MITACLLSWKRQYHLPEIVENLRKFPQITEILVFQNESHGTFPDLQVDNVFYSQTNRFVLGRFLAAKRAENDVVYFQDDDLLVHNIPELIEKFEANDRKKVVANLVDDKSSRHWTWWQTKKLPYVELGFGSLALKSAIHILDDWPYDAHLLERKADKIFTIMNEWEAVYAGPESVSRLFRDGKESGRDGNSLWLREDHKKLTEQAVPLALEWRSSRS